MLGGGVEGGISSGVGDVYLNDFVGPVQWKYFYRGDSQLRNEFISSMTQLKGSYSTLQFLDNIALQNISDLYITHGVSSLGSPFISVTANPQAAGFFARGPRQNQAGFVTTLRIEAREAANLRSRNILVPNFENPHVIFSN